MATIKQIIENNGTKPSTAERFSGWITRYAGSTQAFTFAILLIIAWAVTGPFFDFSETWQLIINTGTTIITFLMVFLIQRAQNKESAIIQIKLNELIAAVKGASNRVLSIESLSEEDLKVLSRFYHALADEAAKDYDLRISHSVEEAQELHERKKKYKMHEDEEDQKGRNIADDQDL